LKEQVNSIDVKYDSLAEADAFIQPLLEEWAKDHVDESLEVIPYDREKYPGQPLDVIRLEAIPALSVGEFAGQITMGEEPYSSLINSLRHNGLIDELASKATAGQSSLVATAHLKNVVDTALAHNAVAVASGNEEFVHRNVIIANPMLKRLGFMVNGELIAANEILRMSGPIIFAMPDAARSYGIPDEIIGMYGRAFTPEFTSAIKKGALIHWALTGTRAKDILLDDGSQAKMLPEVSEEVARIAQKRTPNAMAIAVNIDRNGSSSKVIQPRELQQTSDVHSLMQELADATKQITDSNVVYGLPETAVLL
jgi:hypothetical protein